MAKIVALGTAVNNRFESSQGPVHTEEINMKMRGKLLREPNGGSGLLMVQGQQYKFSLDGVWKSEIAPKAGQDVDVDLDQNLQILSITVISESQIAKEQAEQAMAKVKEQGGKIVGNAIAKFGAPALVAAGCLIVGWFWLTTVSDAVPMLGKLDFTFWQVLQMVNASNPAEVMDRGGNGSAGIYGFLAIVALLGPFLHYFWKDKRAVLGCLTPLAFMVIVGIIARNSLLNAFGGGNIPADLGDTAKQAQAEAMKAISLGLGAYLSGLASLYFAAVGAKQFLVARAGSVPASASAKAGQAAA